PHADPHAESDADADGGYVTWPASEDKVTLRGWLRQLRRDRVPGRDPAADARAVALSALEAAREAGVGRGDWVAAYESKPTEPPTQALVAAFLSRGVRVMLPVTLASWDLDWREADGDGAGGETLGLEAVARASVVFVPAQGVDAHGTRIGQGKGCYDRSLPRTTALLVAVVHPWEVLAHDLPHEPHDRPVDAVIAAGLGLRRLPPGLPGTAG
ncbi:MAG: 5-formyltetrahydrofolate cyclo-ligase, partial [Pedococcus sp.]